MSQPLGIAAKNYARDHGVEAAVNHFRDAFREGHISVDSLSLRGLADGLLGPDWQRKLQAYQENPLRAIRGQEDAVDASTFAQITGNQLIDTVKEKYQSPTFIGDQLVRHIPVANGNLETQKEPWLADVSPTTGVETDDDDDDEDVVQPAMNYNESKFSGNYVLLARPQKRGRLCRVTFEMIYADRTRQAFDSAGSVGRRLGINREKRILKVFLGIRNNFTYSYGGATETSSNTYIETNPGTKWSNQIDSLALQSWSDLNQVEQKFNEMRDPVTGEPIDVEADVLFVMPANYHNAKHIVHATSIQVGPRPTTSSANNTANTLTTSASDMKAYKILTSKWAYKLAANNALFTDQAAGNGAVLTVDHAAAMWLMGQPTKAFYYREVEPLRVWQAPALNPDEFNRDIVLSVKAREFGVAGVQDPRYMVRVFDFTQNGSSS